MALTLNFYHSHAAQRKEYVQIHSLSHPERWYLFRAPTVFPRFLCFHSVLPRQRSDARAALRIDRNALVQQKNNRLPLMYAERPDAEA